MSSRPISRSDTFAEIISLVNYTIRKIPNLFFSGDETKQREFLMLKKAYDILKDDTERKEYDKWRRCMSLIVE
jgi:hypothetical protein